MSQLFAQLAVNRSDFQLNVELTLPGSGVSALFGPSGSGKTTCLRAMAGLERLPGSTFIVGETVWQDESQGIFIPSHLREIGYVFQEASLFPHLNVQQNLDFGQKRVKPELRQIQQQDVVALLGIEHLLKRLPSALSGGERQRVAIARALLTSPKLLLMDEPLSALDLNLKQEILPYLEELHQELSIPVVYVSHAADEVARLADHLTLLKNGEVIASGPTGQVMLEHHSTSLFADGASTLFEGQISNQLTQEHLTEIQSGALSLTVTQRALPLGANIRCRVYASDVSLCLSQPNDTSIMNIFPAKVARVDEGDRAGEVLVLLELAPEQFLRAQISAHSLNRLQLIPGMALWAQVKSVAVL